ncbi:MAG TPA: hypothetical protein VFG68_18380 [Fimbriiglobus sp.]|nr:hypothetical protein [Fimbriiglobus sp.]
MNAFTSRIMLGLGLLGLISTDANAADYVVPPAYANASGTGGASFTLLTLAYTGQQAYAASLFSGLPVGSVIDGFRLRLLPGQATVTSAVMSSNFDISIGPSAFHPGSLTTNTASNQGPGTVLARSGPITFPANSFVGGAGPNPFGPLISFTTPYTYTGSDLLLTISHTGFSSSITCDATTGLSTATAQGQQNVGVYNSSTLPQGFNGFAVIVQFDYVPVPEPSAPMLSGLTLVAGLAYRSFGRRRAKAAA